MKEIGVMCKVTVEISDEEYKTLHDMSFEPQMDDVPYRTISAPDWLMDKVKSSGTITQGGFVPSTTWIKPQTIEIIEE